MAAEIPIIRVGEYLVVPLQMGLDEESAAAFSEYLLNEIVGRRPAGLLIDVSALPLFDLVDFTRVAQLGRGAQLMGVPVAMSGLSPAAAALVSEAGVDISDVSFGCDLAQAIELLQQRGRAQAIGPVSGAEGLQPAETDRE